MDSKDMRVIKRNGQLEEIAFDKILKRIKKIGNEVNIQLNYASLAMKVIDQLYDTIPTSIIDELTAQQCASLSTQHLDYGTLASRIIISNHHKNTNASFYEVMKQLYGNLYVECSESVEKKVSSFLAHLFKKGNGTAEIPEYLKKNVLIEHEHLLNKNRPAKPERRTSQLAEYPDGSKPFVSSVPGGKSKSRNKRIKRNTRRRKNFHTWF